MSPGPYSKYVELRESISLVRYQHELDEFEADKAYNHGSGGRNSGNDLASYSLDFMLRDLSYVIVSCSQICCRGHEVHMGVSVFFELYSIKLNALRSLSFLE